MKQYVKYASHEAVTAEKVVLLYSGGLDTSCMLKWIPEQYGAEVVALTIDVGQGKDTAAVREKAKALGASHAIVVDAKKEFADGYVAKAVKANALYQGVYPASTSIARPLLAKYAVEVAHAYGADAVAHGCTGKGNDQVRIELGVQCLDPELKLLAPVREWSMGREEEEAYAFANGIPVPPKSKYSVDANLWGRSVECGEMEDAWAEPPDDALEWCATSEEAKDSPDCVEIGFEEGVPAYLNGWKMELHELVLELNSLAGSHGVGIIDHIEDRVVGLKSREVYECPAAVCILAAHKDLEKAVSSAHQNSLKPMLDDKWAALAYQGLWFDPVMDALNAFMDEANTQVSGTVKLKLYKGSARVVGRKSENMLYSKSLATYCADSEFNQASAPGFIELFGLSTKTAAALKHPQAKKIRAVAWA
ncbi:MAG: argininosuccinate synthase [Candidatus Micrarchaeota archaeon]